MENKKKSDLSVVEKLRTLYNIQLIDSHIDEIRDFRLNIPIEIQNLKEELEKMKKQLESVHHEILSLKENIDKQNKIKKYSDFLIQKYEKQKDNIKNNKELYSIEKEIDYQKLEIQLSKKRIKEINLNIHKKKEILEKKEEFFKDKKEHFLHKKKELNQILLENEKEEKILLEKKIYISKKIDPNLLKIYKKIRKGVKNGIAVAPVQRGAPLGSYLAITPQKYSELIQRNKLLIDEHSGRILIDAELAEEEKKKYFSKKKTEKN
ncbi:zinc ribbon domain-containing protein [Blattabacterium cuenoti]|uniref:zinc ribbon domain-containing protein n=1 Tax=Blattabacterium cuenoti TaxID=1653831 RepID=UPI00163D0A9C